ncbi:hypothetical protein AMES_3531 [Amycolatopsis mediterranei S699]|uniref:Serine-threonine protein kinase n=2 Tax=Amycolatopsis mediterranei TaxID=33910 RepID=A0A0H3D3Y4_AMYMU|nr:hypothetical protein [Amycolatopsis mediterranei]ADJ45356.1 conserved hypothetical protein [Amycolatopsis mediterranei U32]AEK42116.1 hypothetical protein RAM_18150 [Amycolatopsis mediterranei S699]AFO77067.1 hypothetical protein AMES_3531 [Amycolatopsis mediterranei S699]AGT84195.1 hypothetical protein B737_3531 [Amycolatopsis mediterranei RB]KDO08472.1 hypothetical protein DV26_23230 [Amycolatopsis mediterranei]
MSEEKVPGHDDVSYHLLNFDAAGKERGDDSRHVLAEAEAAQPTDIFVLSHGWNGDVPAARAQYGAWIATMADCGADRERAHRLPGGFRSMLVGLHWPSRAWGEEELGTTSFDAGPSIGTEDLVTRLAARLGNGPEPIEAVRTIVGSALDDIEPAYLPPDVQAAYDDLDRLDEDTSAEGAREPFDAERTYQACRIEDDPVSFGGFSLGGILAPLRVLTFWKMKKRARLFGESGAATLVRDLQGCARDARVHLMGHSFGCIVAAAATAGATRPVASLSLLQGAMSLWSFSAEIPGRPGLTGHFRPLVTHHLVDGATFVNMSVHDRAVGTFYPLGAWSGHQVTFAAEGYPQYGGTGVHGIRGSGIAVVDHSDIAAVESLAPGKVHNVDARTIIAANEGIAGAHNDICHPEVGRLVWQAVISGR